MGYNRVSSDWLDMVLSEQEMSEYVGNARKRLRQEQEQLQLRRQKGIQAARVAAQHLKTVYGVSRVMLFGSFVDGKIHSQSDLDLAVWDLDPVLYWRAWGSIDRLSDEFLFDLVESNQADPVIRAAIEQGIEL